ncbi:restriction endonuclease subunit S [Bacteroides sp. AM41-16]|uniref:restriction endonuclease subunit S n=2 Tax=Bacteroidaceae TaxID=815 RepID=UPI000E750412|nr:restriction endonuclease subunit S [Bacteroides sp. AM41-16]RJU40306.1 restriction endonuclease subunit S [Bacteroides sp. AM41-16]
MNGKQLKNSILQWAIQGKLVPQDSNDEPASVLLERIRAEKAKLVKEKKIKKDKNESIIYRGDDNSYYEKFLATGEVKCIDDEIPFEIPQGWEWCRLKHMCSMQAGKNISASEIYDEKSVLHPYRCVGGNGLRGFTNTFNAEGHFAIIGRQGALCGCLNIESGKFYATEHAVVVNGFGIIPSLFIYYFFTALNLNQYATATAQPGLAVSNIVEVFIPLPPLPEQLRIVSKIEKLLSLVKTYEQAQNGLNELNASLNEQLRKSILQEAIQGKLVPQIAEEGTAEKLLTEIREEKERLIKEGKLKKSALTDSIIFKGDDNKYYEQIGKKCLDITEQIPFEIPVNWAWARMGQIGDWGAGSTPQRGNANYYNGNILWLKTGELNNGIIYDTEEKITQKAFQDCSLRMNKIGDVLIAMYGATIGKLAIVGEDLTTNQACCGCTPYLIYNWYLFYFLMASRDSFIKKGEGGAQPNISRVKLVEHLIPLPPLKEQHRIVAQIEKLFEQLR